MAKVVKVLRVVAKREGFRRAGMEFGAVPKNIPLDTLPSHVLAQLVDDPSLVAFETDMVMNEDGTLRDAAPGDGGTLTLAQIQARSDQLARLEKTLSDFQAELNDRKLQLDEREADLVAREEAGAAAAAQAEQMAAAAQAAAAEQAKPATGKKQS